LVAIKVKISQNGSKKLRIIAKSTLVKFWRQSSVSDARGPLESWYDEAVAANWKTPQCIKNRYQHASICSGNRVVFNIAGNKYRLVVEIQYRVGIIWVKFVGTHAAYDQIKAEEVNEY
jgi:mRNA interferase HigB